MLPDGTEIDSTRDSDPVILTMGKGEVIPGLEKALTNMKAGERKSVDISCDDAFGPYDTDLAVEIPKDDLPEEIEPELGMELEFIPELENGEENEEMEPINFTIIDIRDDSLILDANHPLAGQDMVYEIEVISID